jgi:hypothetical protein
MTQKKILENFIPFLILTAAVFASYLIVVQAQTGIVNEPTDEEISTLGITFPIPELGNCGDKEECKKYCNDPANIPACVKFAKEHGLMNESEVKSGKIFEPLRIW